MWQQPEDFLRVQAWPASLSSSHVRCVCGDVKLRLTLPATSQQPLLEVCSNDIQLYVMVCSMCCKPDIFFTCCIISLPLTTVGTSLSGLLFLLLQHRTVVDVALLQLWDSMRLCNPTISLSGFLKGIVDAVAVLHPTQVRLWHAHHPACLFCLLCAPG